MRKLPCRIIAILVAVILFFTGPDLTAFAAETGTSDAASQQEHYIVVLLDNQCRFGFAGTASGGFMSTNGSPVTVEKASAKAFVDYIAGAGSNYHVALVTYARSQEVIASFDTSLEEKLTAISKIREVGEQADINSAFKAADSLLSEISSENTVKSIVILSEGYTEGDYLDEGHYEDDGCSVRIRLYNSDTIYVEPYKFCNAVYETADGLKEKYNIYHIGYFGYYTGYFTTEYSTFLRQFCYDISNSGYIEANTQEELTEAFLDVASWLVTGSEPVAYPFSFSGTIIKDDTTATCYYTDNYFLNDSSMYNASLATMSLCLELTTWSRYDTSAVWTTDTSVENTKFSNTRDLLIDQLGFKDFQVNSDWGAAPTTDSIGVAAAHKAMPDGTPLIALAIRGGGYEQEWASNFTIGNEDDHDGFSAARDSVLDFLQQYINDNGITGKIKLWIVGFSRAGATANMVAGALDNGYTLSNVTLASKDLYAYAFEPPSGVYNDYEDPSIYSNIHNILNRNDPVPFMAPKVWNFTRYTDGSDTYLPSVNTTDQYYMISNTMKSFFYQLSDGAEYKIEENVPQYSLSLNSLADVAKTGSPLFRTIEYDIPTESALNNSFQLLFTRVIPSRSYYYNNLQAGFQDLLTKLYGGSMSSLMEDMTIEEFLQTFFSKMSNDRFLEIVSPLVSSIHFTYNVQKFHENCDTFVSDVLNDSTLWRNIQFSASLTTTIKDLFYNFMSAACDDVMKNSGYNIQALANIISLVREGALFQAHYGEITLSWLMTLDPNYTSSIPDVNNLRCTRDVRINCPVDIEVYDDQNRLRAKFVNDEVQDVGDIGLNAFVNLDGEKVVYLPADGSYHIKITARDDGEVNVSIGEYSYVEEAYTRLQNYYGVPIALGDELNLRIPAFSDSDQESDIPNGSSTNYSFRNNDNSIITCSYYCTGADKAGILNTVIAESENDFGYVMGGGDYSTGSFAEVNAYAQDGYQFCGWYCGDELVSEEECYRFAVTKDTALVAKFEEVAEETEESSAEEESSENTSSNIEESSEAESAAPESTETASPAPESTETASPVLESTETTSPALESTETTSPALESTETTSSADENESTTVDESSSSIESSGSVESSAIVETSDEEETSDAVESSETKESSAISESSATAEFQSGIESSGTDESIRKNDSTVTKSSKEASSTASSENTKPRTPVSSYLETSAAPAQSSSESTSQKTTGNSVTETEKSSVSKITDNLQSETIVSSDSAIDAAIASPGAASTETEFTLHNTLLALRTYCQTRSLNYFRFCRNYVRSYLNAGKSKNFRGIQKISRKIFKKNFYNGHLDR